MRIGFRQGLLSFQRDAGAPVYLQPSSTPNFVSHVISPTPTIATFAHGASDYLLKFDDAVPVAWGPVTAGITNHLYWDIDLLTAAVSRGITLLEPVYSGSAPLAPANDQHWFTADGVMRVWSVSKNKWLERVRLFAGKVMNGNTNTITMFTEGSQAGLTTPSNPGFIMLDTMLQPLRKSSQNGEFLTDDDATRVLSTVGTAGVLVQPVSRVVPVRAGEIIPRMSLVYFSADDTVRLASSNPALMPSRPPVGIMIDGLVGGEIGSLVQSGELSYDQWDFSGNAGKPVYCDSNGQVTLTRPSGLMAYRVGFVKNARTVLVMVDAETNPQVYTATTEQITISGNVPVQIADAVNGLGERVVTISVPNATALQPGLMTSVQFQELIDYEARLTTAEGGIGALELNKSGVGHMHLISDVNGLQGMLDNKSDITHNHDLVYAPIEHAHLIGDVAGLQTSLDQKAYRAHLNAFTEVFTSVDRTGVFDVGVGVDLTAALGDKSDVWHGHALGDLSDVDLNTPPNQNDVLTFDGNNWVPGIPTAGAAGGTVQQVFTLEGTTDFGFETAQGWNVSELYLLASPVCLWDTYYQELNILQNGFYKIKLALHISPPTGYSVSPWPEELSAFGTVLYHLGSGRQVGMTRSNHTRYSDPSSPTRSNANLGPDFQPSTAFDEYSMFAYAGDTIRIASFTGAFSPPAVALTMTFKIVMTVEQVSTYAPGLV
jgi:hypothetical protein